MEERIKKESQESIKSKFLNELANKEEVTTKQNLKEDTVLREQVVNEIKAELQETVRKELETSLRREEESKIREKVREQLKNQIVAEEEAKIRNDEAILGRLRAEAEANIRKELEEVIRKSEPDEEMESY
jgi:uncharacterized protein YnzC (UPF0291/DUF896 family)